jgi:hypothetical protein
MNSWYDSTMELIHAMNSWPTKNPDGSSRCGDASSTSASAASTCAIADAAPLFILPFKIEIPMVTFRVDR